MTGNDAKAARVHLAVDPLGYLLALVVTPADEQDRAQIKELVELVQETTGQQVQVAFVESSATLVNSQRRKRRNKASTWR